MECQKIMNLLDNTPNQPTKFRTKNLVKLTDDAHGTYKTNIQIKFESSCQVYVKLCKLRCVKFV